MRESIFNIYFNTDDGNKLAFNSVSCSLAIVDKNYDELITKLGTLDEQNCPEYLKETLEAAKEGNFIVEEAKDELLDLEIKRNCQKYSTEQLGLTIAPTLACNFKCVYCFENSKPGLMNEKVMERVIDFVNKKAESIKFLDVTWYGGEPLLATDVINKLSERFISICKDKNIEYGAYIITNGSLIDHNVISNMLKFKIKGVQITLDGPPEIHDKRRINKKGESTFETIIENINALLATGEIEIAIRINIDKSNEENLDALLKILKEKLISKNVKISFGQVSALTEACKSVESTCFNNKEFASNISSYYELLKRHGFDVYNEFPYPQVKLNYCCSEVLQSLVVDHEGNLYKCWNQIGDVETAIGNLLDDDFDLTNYKHGMWLGRNPFCNEECRKCKLLPICMGGCPYNNVALKKENECDLIKYNIKEVMLEYYNQFMNGKI